MTKLTQTNQDTTIQSPQITNTKADPNITSNESTIVDRSIPLINAISVSKEAETRKKRNTLISDMDSSDDEDSVTKSVKPTAIAPENLSLLSSYIFVELGNAILHSPEVEKEYLKKKTELVDNLRKQLIEKKAVSEDFNPTRSDQLIDILLALKFNDEKSIDEAINLLPRKLSKVDEKSINSVLDSKGAIEVMKPLIVAFQIDKMKSVTATLDKILKDAFAETTDIDGIANKLSKSISVGRKEPSLETIKKMLEAANLKTMARSSKDSVERAEINCEFEKKQAEVYKAAGSVEPEKGLKKAYKVLHEEKIKFLETYVRENLSPDKNIYNAIRDRLTALRPGSLFENQNVASTLANARLDHKINRQFAKDSYIFDRATQKKHSYGHTELVPKSNDTSYWEVR